MDIFFRPIIATLTYAAVPFVTIMIFAKSLRMLLPATGIIYTSSGHSSVMNGAMADLNYYPPAPNQVNTLSTVLNATGVYGFVFNTSQTPQDVPFSTYNWCNMPHTRLEEYITPPQEYVLKYVEVIHRHHKRTPYAANSFPVETQAWDCSDTALFTYGQPKISSKLSAPTFWKYYQSAINPFVPAGFPPHTCAFPQITKDGLDDSYQHGKDLWGVYHDPLHLTLSATEFRVTNNPITSEVAGMVISGMFGPLVTTSTVPLRIQASGIDSLEPQYTCAAASALYSSYGPGSYSPPWTKHLNLTQKLFSKLDAIAGIDPLETDWHLSYDHYFDNLSARLCHQRPLPCNSTFNPPRCVERKDANEVFRLGEYEYAFIYRSAGNHTLQASRASFGVWVAELAENLRTASGAGETLKTVYRHNVAHDGSMARLLSILQLDNMVWPGLGSEVIFELYLKGSQHFVRILWSGQPLKSSTPTLQAEQDLIPLERLLAYFDGLVGRKASLVRRLCAA